MSFTTSYRTLFEVKLLHHYFLNRAESLFDNMDDVSKGRSLMGYDVSNFVNIEPTPACARNLSKYRLIYKNTPFGFIVGTRSRKSGAKYFPAIEIEDDLQFTFKLTYNDVFFANYTSLPLVRTEDAVYYFQNRVTGSAKKYPFLSGYAAVFAAGTYSSGDILGDAATNPAKLFIANKLTDKTPPHADWAEDELVSGKPLQYVTKADLLPVYTEAIRYKTDQAGLSLTATAQNRRGETIPLQCATVTDSDKSVALVDIHNLPEGYYTVTLDDSGKPYNKQFPFYKLAKKGGMHALIDISVKSDDASYNLFNGDGSFKEPVYELRFKNRATVWRYLGAQFTNKPESGPHPLTSRGVVAVTVKNKDAEDVADVPNAGIEMVKTEHPDDDNAHYNVISEIYIN